jgi:hypothetical protein
MKTAVETGFHKFHGTGNSDLMSFKVLSKRKEK